MTTFSAPGAALVGSRVRAIALDFLERAGWTAGQQFIAVLLTTSTVATTTTVATTASIAGLPWRLAAVLAAGAAVVSVVTTALQYLSRVTRQLSFWEDLSVRLTKTFLASLLAAFGASALNVLEFDWKGALNLAAVATLGALAKGLLARGPVGAGAESTATPSTLPTSTYRESLGMTDG